MTVNPGTLFLNFFIRICLVRLLRQKFACFQECFENTLLDVCAKM